MMYFKRIIAILLSLSITSSCGQPNLLTEYSETDTDEALYLDAKMSLDKAEYDDAIDIITQKLSSSFQSRADVKNTLMHAYGGKCGIAFFDLLEALKNTSSSKMFEIALQLFAGKITNVSACDNALDVLMSIGATADERTKQQNLFAAILGLTRMAVTLRSKFDTESSGLGNGIVDPSANACVVGNGAGQLSDAEVDRIVTGVGLVFENLEALGEELTSGSAGGSFDSALSLCETPIPVPAIGTPQDHGAPGGVTWTMLGLSSNNPTYQDFGLPADVADPISCVTTRDADVTPKLRRIFRRMIDSSELGVGSCDISDIAVNFNVNMPPTISISMNCCPGLTTP